MTGLMTIELARHKRLVEDRTVKSLSRIFILCIALSNINSVMATKVVFLGDSNTALTYLNPKNNPEIKKDFRFTSLVKKYLPNITTVNSAVGGAKTADFLQGGKFFSPMQNRGWDKKGDIYVICFGLNDAPRDLKGFYRTQESVLKKFESETWKLITLVLRYNPGAKVALMTNVPLNFDQEDFQYNREEIIDSYDDVYREIGDSSPLVDLIDVNYHLKWRIIENHKDLRIRRFVKPVLDKSMDNSLIATSMPEKLWKTNIHYNKNGSKYVAEFLGSTLLD